MAPRAAIRPGPSLRVRTRRTGATARGRAARVTRTGAGQPQQGGAGEDGRDHGGEQVAGPVPAEADGQGALAGQAVAVDVADVVGQQDRDRAEADRQGGGRGHHRDPLQLHIGRPAGRHHAEEGEHGQLAVAGVAVRPRPARVEHRGGHGRHPDSQQPEVHGHGQGQPGHGSDGEGDRGRPAHGRRGGQAGGGQPGRAQPSRGVGAPQPVGVVVGVVHPDLQGHRHDQGGQRPPGHQRPLGGGRGRPHQHRAHGRDQRPRPSPLDPDVHRAGGPRAAWGTWRNQEGASRGRRCGPPGPPQSCSRGGWRPPPAAGPRPGRRCRR